MTFLEDNSRDKEYQKLRIFKVSKEVCLSLGWGETLLDLDSQKRAVGGTNSSMMPARPHVNPGKAGDIRTALLCRTH